MAKIGKIYLSANQYKKTAEQPGYKGKGTILGRKVEASGWIEKGEYGPYISISIQEPYVKPEQPQAAPQPQAAADGFWRWLAMHKWTPQVAWFRKMFGGMPDNLCIKPLNDKYCLAMCLELKSRRGHLHGRQKADARSLPWIVCRTPEEAKEAIDNFIERKYDEPTTTKKPATTTNS